MVNALKSVSVNKGYDPRFFLSSNWWRRPYARRLSRRRTSDSEVIIPLNAAYLCFWNVNVRFKKRLYSYRCYGLKTENFQTLQNVFHEMEEVAIMAYNRDNYEKKDIIF
jgi:hypothetical protein